MKFVLTLAIGFLIGAATSFPVAYHFGYSDCLKTTKEAVDYWNLRHLKTN